MFKNAQQYCSGSKLPWPTTVIMVIPSQKRHCSPGRTNHHLLKDSYSNSEWSPHAGIPRSSIFFGFGIPWTYSLSKQGRQQPNNHKPQQQQQQQQQKQNDNNSGSCKRCQRTPTRIYAYRSTCRYYTHININIQVVFIYINMYVYILAYTWSLSGIYTQLADCVKPSNFHQEQTNPSNKSTDTQH